MLVHRNGLWHQDNNKMVLGLHNILPDIQETLPGTQEVLSCTQEMLPGNKEIKERRSRKKSDILQSQRDPRNKGSGSVITAYWGSMATGYIKNNEGQPTC